MTKSECVKRARAFNHLLVSYRLCGLFRHCSLLRIRRDAYMRLARESFIVGPGY